MDETGRRAPVVRRRRGACRSMHPYWSGAGTSRANARSAACRWRRPAGEAWPYLLRAGRGCSWPPGPHGHAGGDRYRRGWYYASALLSQGVTTIGYAFDEPPAGDDRLQGPRQVAGRDALRQLHGQGREQRRSPGLLYVRLRDQARPRCSSSSRRADAMRPDGRGGPQARRSWPGPARLASRQLLQATTTPAPAPAPATPAPLVMVGRPTTATPGAPVGCRPPGDGRDALRSACRHRSRV